MSCLFKMITTIRVEDASPQKRIELVVEDGTFASSISVFDDISCIVSPFTNEGNWLARIAWICDTRYIAERKRSGGDPP